MLKFVMYFKIFLIKYVRILLFKCLKFLKIIENYPLN